MQIDDNVIDHLCFMARLSLSPAEKESLKQDLSKILSYVETLKTVDVANVKPLIHSLEEKHTNIWREDKPGPKSLPVDKALQNAPKRKANFFEVPKIIE